MLCLEDAAEARAICDFYSLPLSPSADAVLCTGTGRVYPRTDENDNAVTPPLVCSRAVIEATRQRV